MDFRRNQSRAVNCDDDNYNSDDDDDDEDDRNWKTKKRIGKNPVGQVKFEEILVICWSFKPTINYWIQIVIYQYFFYYIFWVYLNYLFSLNFVLFKFVRFILFLLCYVYWVGYKFISFFSMIFKASLLIQIKNINQLCIDHFFDYFLPSFSPLHNSAFVQSLVLRGIKLIELISDSLIWIECFFIQMVFKWTE